METLEGAAPEARDPGRLFDIFRQVCRGVAHAHEADDPTLLVPREAAAPAP